MTYRGAYRVLQKAWAMDKEVEDYPDFDDINEALTVIGEAVERLEQIKQVWNSEEWCQGIPCNADGLKSLFNYNLDLFNENLTLNKRVLDLEKENQELKARCKAIPPLVIKNEKYQKATEILKRSFTVRLEKLEPHHHIVICGNIRKLTQEEYNLLKEVLGE